MKEENKISPELLEIVERYYNNTLTVEERTNFDVKLQNEPEFKVLVEDLKNLIIGVETQSLKEHLDDFHKEIPSNDISINDKTFSIATSKSYWKLAIAAILIISIGIFWFLREPINERLYAKYFVADPGLPTTMSSSDNFAFYDAMVNYKHGDYKTAIKKWEILHDKVSQNDTLNYFLGSAYLADKNEDKAIPYLEVVTSSGESVFLNEAYYYLGFAYLKKGNIASAKRNFENSNLENSKTIRSKLD